MRCVRLVLKNSLGLHIVPTMTSQHTDARIHVMDAATDAEKVVRDVCLSGAQEDAFYVMDVGDVVRKLKHWREKMPRVQPFYGVKCNPSKVILEVLAAMGTGFDCASKGEIDMMLELGVDVSRIIYANPTKTPSFISHAASVGVDLMTFDNEAELHKIKHLHPKAKLVIRIATDAQGGVSNASMKFGCDSLLEAPRLMKLANILGLTVHGVCFHVGTCDQPQVYRTAISDARRLFDLGKMLGYDMRMVNIGGGFPGGKGTSIDEVSKVINLALFEYFPSNDVTVISEPGQYFVDSCCTLATRIHSKREVFSADRQDLLHVMYYINDGAYTSFRFAITRKLNIVPTTLSTPVGKLIPSSIWGQTCDGQDKVNDNILVPVLDIGDWLIYENRGAYTLPIMCGFNGFPTPKVHIVADGATWELMSECWSLSRKKCMLDSRNTSSVILGE